MRSQRALLSVVVTSNLVLSACAGEPIDFRSGSAGTGGTAGTQTASTGGATGGVAAVTGGTATGGTAIQTESTGGVAGDSSTVAGASATGGTAACVTRAETYNVDTEFPNEWVGDLTVYPECVPTCGIRDFNGDLWALALPAGGCTTEPACSAGAYPPSCDPACKAPGPFNGYLCTCVSGRWSCVVAQPGAGVCAYCPLGECASRAPQDCAGTCTPIKGSQSNGLLTSAYESCHSSTEGCASAVGCAYPEGHPENCLIFPSLCTPPGWVQDASCASPLCPKYSSSTSECQSGKRLQGAAYDIAGSHFAFGSIPVRNDTASSTRWEGTHGVLVISFNGSVLGSMNAGAPERSLPDWSSDTAALTAHVVQYFEGMGVPSCQIASTNVLGGSQGRTIGLSRGVGGIAVVESYAFAQFRSNDQTTTDEIYWPPIPAETVTAAQSLQAALADPQALASYKAKLPDNAQGTGRIAIHHTDGTSTASYQTAATYDVDYSSPLGMGTTLHFDANGNAVTLW